MGVDVWAWVGIIAAEVVADTAAAEAAADTAAAEVAAGTAAAQAAAGTAAAQAAADTAAAEVAADTAAAIPESPDEVGSDCMNGVVQATLLTLPEKSWQAVQLNC